MVSTITWRKWKDGLVSPAGSVSSRQSATGARSPLDTLRVPRLRPQSLRKKRDKQALVSLFWQGQKDLVSAPFRSARSLRATGTHSPLGTRFWSGCGRAHQGAGKGRCHPVPSASPREGGAGLVLGGNYPSQNRRKRAENPRKSRKHIDLNRQRPYNKKCRGNPAGVCCRQAVSHSLLLNAERG